VPLEHAIVKDRSKTIESMCCGCQHCQHFTLMIMTMYQILPKGKRCGHIVLMQTAVQNCYSQVRI